MAQVLAIYAGFKGCFCDFEDGISTRFPTRECIMGSSFCLLSKLSKRQVAEHLYIVPALAAEPIHIHDDISRPLQGFKITETKKDKY